MAEVTSNFLLLLLCSMNPSESIMDSSHCIQSLSHEGSSLSRPSVNWIAVMEQRKNQQKLLEKIVAEICRTCIQKYTCLIHSCALIYRLKAHKWIRVQNLGQLQGNYTLEKEFSTFESWKTGWYTACIQRYTGMIYYKYAQKIWLAGELIGTLILIKIRD